MNRRKDIDKEDKEGRGGRKCKMKRRKKEIDKEDKEGRGEVRDEEERSKTA